MSAPDLIASLARLLDGGVLALVQRECQQGRDIGHVNP